MENLLIIDTMVENDLVTPAPSLRGSGALRRRAAALLLAVAAASCNGSSGVDDQEARGTPSGPLCDQLPQGSDPGGPELLREMTAEEALTWMPVLTVFEAGVRASGLDVDLRRTDGVTILAPTDDTFNETFTEATLDDLILFRQEELRELLEAHMIGGSHTIADLIDDGEARTLAGTTVEVTGADGGARFDDRATTICADYEVANARIHIIDGVLGELPEPAPEDPGPEGN